MAGEGWCAASELPRVSCGGQAPAAGTPVWDRAFCAGGAGSGVGALPIAIHSTVAIARAPPTLGQVIKNEPPHQSE